MLIFICQFFLCLFIGSLFALIFAWGLMKMLNPTATDKEIFKFWIKNFRKNRSEGKLF